MLVILELIPLLVLPLLMMQFLLPQQIQDQIKIMDHPYNIGWIVDLRGNGGGNMWPMLAGIGPILGEGIAGYFIDP